MRIAILGATSQIARDLIVSLAASEDISLHLFARRTDVAKKWLDSAGYSNRYLVIAEISTSSAPVRICRIGVNDRFSEHCGTYAYLINEHRLDNASIQSKIDGLLKLNA